MDPRRTLRSLLFAVVPLVTLCFVTHTPIRAAGPSAGPGDQRPVETPMTSASGEHYEFACPDPAKCDASLRDRLTMLIGDAKGGVKLLEAAYKNYSALFGASPKLAKGEKLKVRLHATEAEHDATMAKDGVPTEPNQLIRYHFGNKTLYVCMSKLALFTRDSLLNGAARQFYSLARTNNAFMPPRWYASGFSCYAAGHMWDGATLKSGVIQPLYLEDPWAAALKRVTDKSFNLANLISDSESELLAGGSPVCMALYGYLTEAQGGKLKKKLDAVAKQIDVGGWSVNLFKESIGDPADLQPDFAKWVASHQQAWVQAFNEWEGIGEGRMAGQASGVTSGCYVKADALELSAALELPKKPDGTLSSAPWRGGFMLGCVDKQNYTLAMLDNTGQIEVSWYKGGQWNPIHKAAFSKAKEAGIHRLRAVRADDKIELWINDGRVGAWVIAGPKLGLSLSDCRLTFRDVKVTAKPSDAAKGDKGAKPDKAAGKDKAPAGK